jgi:hypothetical protein
MTTDDEIAAEIEREIDAKLESELQARRAQLREDIALRMRRAAAFAHLDRVNARHPIMDPLCGLTVEQEAERQRQMAERTRLSNEKMDRANARVVPGMRASLRTKRSDGPGARPLLRSRRRADGDRARR